MRPRQIAILSLLVFSSTAPAEELAKIERKFVKEPAYRTTPKYCLLVLGVEAKTHVWLVQDCDALYVDRNGNGDLTEPDEKVVAEKSKHHAADDRDYTFNAGELREGGKRHTNLSVWVSDLNPGLREAKALLERDPQARSYHVRLEVEMPGFQGLGAGGRLVQGAISDANGLLQFADRPQDAPIIHFGGPWTMSLYRPTTLWLDRSNNVDLIFGTPGLGAGSFAYVGYEGVVPDNLAARLEAGASLAPPDMNDHPYQPERTDRYSALYSRWQVDSRVRPLWERRSTNLGCGEGAWGWSRSRLIRSLKRSCHFPLRGRNESPFFPDEPQLPIWFFAVDWW
jgi:hypothetical protein